MGTLWQAWAELRSLVENVWCSTPAAGVGAVITLGRGYCMYRYGNGATNTTPVYMYLATSALSLSLLLQLTVQAIECREARRYAVGSKHKIALATSGPC